MAKFEKGKSGNPAGRPGWTRSVSTLRQQLLNHDDVAAIVATLVEKARSGDVTAIGIVMDRLLPRLRAMAPPVQVDLPDGDLVAKGNAVLDLMAGGELSPDQASEILNNLGTVARLIETTELEKRLAALELKYLESTK